MALSAKFSILDDKVLLAQTGYLTIKAVRGTTVTLGYPNREVSVSMARLYAEAILDKNAINRAGEGYLADYLEDGNLSAFVKEVNRIVLGIDYQAFPLSSEASCRAAVFIMVSSSSTLITARCEAHNAHGRSDLEIQTDKNYWVLEFKYCRKGDSPEALPSRSRSSNKGSAVWKSAATEQLDKSSVGLLPKREEIHSLG